MKKLLLLGFTLLAGNVLAQSPITIEQNDMPEVGDTLRVSLAATGTNLNLQFSGPNHNWDFTALQPISQKVESFVSVGSTGFSYQLLFNNQLFAPSTYSNLASPVQLPGQLAGMGITNPLGFYRASNSQYHQTGWGGNLNGTNVPVAFNNVDVIYQFPLTYQSINLSASDYEANAPGLGYLGHQQTRTNLVDGWGTATTLFGTFDVLRLVSTIEATDTIYMNGQGFRIDQPLTREYKWLAKDNGNQNLGIPLVQITTQEIQGVEMATQVQFRDHYRNLNPNSAADDLFSASISVAPNPFSDQLTIKLPGNKKVTLALYDNLGRKIIEKSANGSVFTFTASDLGSAQGIYFLKITDGNSTKTEKLVRIN